MVLMCDNNETRCVQTPDQDDGSDAGEQDDGDEEG
jgi:hypothetical protein